MMRRYHDWTRRAFGPPPLGAQPDLWRLPPEHPAALWVRNRLISLNHSATDADIAACLSRPLINDVLHAAGAAEYTANRVVAAVNAVEEFVERDLRPTWSDRDLGDLRLAHPLVDYVYIDWASFLEKLGTLMNRVRRNEDEVSSGLLRALRPGHDPQRRIESAFDRLSAALDRDRSLIFYSRHQTAFTNPAARARVQWGRIVLPIPCVPPAPVHLVDQLTWAEGGDVLTFTRDAMDAVEAFIEEMLAAFESA